MENKSVLFLSFVCILLSFALAPVNTLQLNGFSVSPYWSEQIKNVSFGTDVQIEVGYSTCFYFTLFYFSSCNSFIPSFFSTIRLMRLQMNTWILHYRQCWCCMPCLTATQSQRPSENRFSPPPPPNSNTTVNGYNKLISLFWRLVGTSHRLALWYTRNRYLSFYAYIPKYKK